MQITQLFCYLGLERDYSQQDVTSTLNHIYSFFSVIIASLKTKTKSKSQIFIYLYFFFLDFFLSKTKPTSLDHHFHIPSFHCFTILGSGSWGKLNTWLLLSFTYRSYLYFLFLPSSALLRKIADKFSPSPF